MLAGVLVTKLMHLKVSWYLFPIKSRFGKDSITQPAESYPAQLAVMLTSICIPISMLESKCTMTEKNNRDNTVSVQQQQWTRISDISAMYKNTHHSPVSSYLLSSVSSNNFLGKWTDGQNNNVID